MCLAGRALHSAGLVSPELLAAAQEEDVKKALAAGLPGALKKASQDKYASQAAQCLALLVRSVVFAVGCCCFGAAMWLSHSIYDDCSTLNPSKACLIMSYNLLTYKTVWALEIHP